MGTMRERQRKVDDLASLDRAEAGIQDLGHVPVEGNAGRGHDRLPAV